MAWHGMAIDLVGGNTHEFPVVGFSLGSGAAVFPRGRLGFSSTPRRPRRQRIASVTKAGLERGLLDQNCHEAGSRMRPGVVPGGTAHYAALFRGTVTASFPDGLRDRR
jgi:hypothetical protein